jgi:hypothetical protein
MAFYFVSTFAIAQTPTKQPALRLSRTKNLHFAKATFPGFSAAANKAKVELKKYKAKTLEQVEEEYLKTINALENKAKKESRKQ